MAKSNTVTIARSYAHRTHGQIGAVELAVPLAGDVTLNGQVLPPTSVEHLFTFALQTLQDAYAGAESAADAKAAFEAKLTRLLEGTLGVRTGGSAVAPEVAAMRYVMRPLVKKAYGDGWKALEEAEIVAMIDAAYAGLSDEDRAAVDAARDARLAELAKMREAKTGLGGIKLSIG